MAKTDLQPIFSDDHYQMKKLVRGDRFQSRLQEVLDAWTAHGISVPKKGFKSAKEYYAWMEKLRSVCNQVADSKRVARAVEKIDSNPALSATEKVWQRLAVQDSFLPPLPYTLISKLLEESGLDPENKEYRIFITKYVFFGYEDFSAPFFSVQGKPNEQTGKREVWLKLEPHTKLTHIEALWDRIEPYLKMLPGYVGKNKPWEEFERDLEIYDTYEEIRTNMTGKRASHQSGDVGLDTKTWQVLRERNSGKYKRLTLSQIRKSVSRIATLDQPNSIKR